MSAYRLEPGGIPKAPEHKKVGRYGFGGGEGLPELFG